jgi:hypothetical protein
VGAPDQVQREAAQGLTGAFFRARPAGEPELDEEEEEEDDEL